MTPGSITSRVGALTKLIRRSRQFVGPQPRRDRQSRLARGHLHQRVGRGLNRVGVGGEKRRDSVRGIGD